MPGDLGIFGGGQLGMMTCEAALLMGIKTTVFTNDPNGCAIRVADRKIVGPYENESLLRDFYRAVGPDGVITVEFENVPVTSLGFLSGLGARTRPAANVLRIAQDRLLEKNTVRDLGIPTTTYADFNSLVQEKDPDAACWPFLPGILKTNRLGYDGKGQTFVGTFMEARNAWEQQHRVDCELEHVVEYKYEISVIIARNEAGEMLVFPPVKNTHRGGILRKTHYKAGLIPEEIVQTAIAYTRAIAEHLKIVGLLTVEFFVTKKNRLLVNEIAPRPHNSGHWTIEGCATSQYKALIQAVFGLPFTPVNPVAEAVMINLIGAEIRMGELYLDEGWHLHDYGKKEIMPGRKMGHVTRIRYAA